GHRRGREPGRGSPRVGGRPDPAGRGPAERVMGAVGTRVRSELRSRWRSSVALAAVVAVAVGVVLAAGAGARRTQTAYPRFLREGRAADVLVSPQGTGLRGGLYTHMAALPDVDHIAVVAGIPTAIVLPSGRRIAAVSTL